MNRHTTFLLAFLLISAAWANAVSKNEQQLTIKVLSADTESTPLQDDNNGAPKDCGIMDYSAYCHHSRTAIVRHTMMVQDSNGNTFTIGCTVDSIWSKCAPLPAGEVFSARRTKRGITVWYRNAKGKEVKQDYALVGDGDKSLARPQQDLPGADALNSSGARVAEINRDTAKCSITSNPPGADIMLDGKYVGNTPSTIVVGPGAHTVALSMPGFATWKRELTVTAGSDVDVSAALQKPN
jgi:hypothetical protein